MNKTILLDILTTDPKNMTPIGVYELFRGYLPNNEAEIFNWSNDYQQLKNHHTVYFLDYIIESSVDAMLPISPILYHYASASKEQLGKLKLGEEEGFILGYFNDSILLTLNDRSETIYLVKPDEISSFEQFVNISSMLHLALSIELIKRNNVQVQTLFEHATIFNQKHVEQIACHVDFEGDHIEKLPTGQYKWLDGYGDPHLPSTMETSHLYYTLRMVWNHIVPHEFSISPRRDYDFSANKSYTISYFKTSVIELLSEINKRKDISHKLSKDIAMANDNISIIKTL